MKSVRHLYCHAIALVGMLLWMGQSVWAQDVNKDCHISIVAHKSDASVMANDYCQLQFLIKNYTVVDCSITLRKHNSDTILFAGKTKWPITLASNIRLPQGLYDVECKTDTLVYSAQGVETERLWCESRALLEVNEGDTEIKVLYQPEVFGIMPCETVFGWDFIGDTTSGARFLDDGPSRVLDMQQLPYCKQKVIIL